MTFGIFILGIDCIGDGCNRLNCHFGNLFCLILKLFIKAVVGPFDIAVELRSHIGEIEHEADQCNLYFDILTVGEGDAVLYDMHSDHDEIDHRADDTHLQNQLLVMVQNEQGKHREDIGEHHHGAAGEHDEQIHDQIAEDNIVLQLREIPVLLIIQTGDNKRRCGKKHEDKKIREGFRSFDQFQKIGHRQNTDNQRPPFQQFSIDFLILIHEVIITG